MWKTIKRSRVGEEWALQWQQVNMSTVGKPYYINYFLGAVGLAGGAVLGAVVANEMAENEQEAYTAGECYSHKPTTPFSC